VFESVEPVQVADKDLQRRDDGREQHRHDQHDARMFDMALVEQIPPADPADNKAGRQIGRREHMGEAVRERRVENNLEPVFGVKDAVLGDPETLRRLHPAIRRQNPEGGNAGADGDDDGRCEMHLVRHTVPPEQHDAKERGFKEKSG